MSPHANVSNRMEMTSLGNLDETGPVQDMMYRIPLGMRRDEIFGTVGSSQGIRASREGEM